MKDYRPTMAQWSYWTYKLYPKLRPAAVSDRPGTYCYVYTGIGGVQKILSFKTEAIGRRFVSFLEEKKGKQLDWNLSRKKITGGYGEFVLYVDLPASPLRAIVQAVPEGIDFQI
jgi:hypothetical protein